MLSCLRFDSSKVHARVTLRFPIAKRKVGGGHYSPGPIGHKLLPAEYDEHVDARQVKDPRPVLEHPVPGVLMNELILKIEHKRVIRRYLHVHFLCGATAALFYAMPLESPDVDCLIAEWATIRVLLFELHNLCALFVVSGTALH